MCQCLFFFDFLWDLCGDRDWDLDFFPDFLGDLDRDRLDLLGVLEPDGDLKKQTRISEYSPSKTAYILIWLKISFKWAYKPLIKKQTQIYSYCMYTHTDLFCT